jgi:hypothetical protein
MGLGAPCVCKYGLGDCVAHLHYNLLLHSRIVSPEIEISCSLSCHCHPNLSYGSDTFHIFRLYKF